MSFSTVSINRVHHVRPLYIRRTCSNKGKINQQRLRFHFCEILFVFYFGFFSHSFLSTYFNKYITFMVSYTCTHTHNISACSFLYTTIMIHGLMHHNNLLPPKITLSLAPLLMRQVSHPWKNASTSLLMSYNIKKVVYL
jgi:hypothetical protein